MKSEKRWVRLMVLSTFGTVGCASEDGLREASEAIFGPVAEAVAEGLVEASRQQPANLRARLDLACDAENLCDDEGHPLAQECEVRGSLWVEEVRQPLIDCALECDSSLCVESAVAEAGLEAPADMRERCENAVDACEVVTDACGALAAVHPETQAALDACHTEPCELLQECYAKVLLEQATE